MTAPDEQTSVTIHTAGLNAHDAAALVEEAMQDPMGLHQRYRQVDYYVDDGTSTRRLNHPGWTRAVVPGGVTGSRRLIAAHEADAHGIKAATVRQWVHRHRLQPRALDRHGRKLYLLDDILGLAGKSCSLPENMASCHAESPADLCPHNRAAATRRG